MHVAWHRESRIRAGNVSVESKTSWHPASRPWRSHSYLHLSVLFIHRIPYSQNHKTFECFGICFQSVKSALVHFVFGTPGGVQIFQSQNLSSCNFGRAFSCPFFQSRIKQYGIIPETAYYMEIIFAQRLDKIPLKRKRLPPCLEIRFRCSCMLIR